MNLISGADPETQAPTLDLETKARHLENQDLNPELSLPMLRICF